MTQTTNPGISIIVPVYNVADYLPQCLDSIINQTFTDWEAIIIDDGSTDGSADICDRYGMAEPRFRVYHQPNRGLACVRNHALGLAKAPFIGFVDSDDWIEPEMFETLYHDINAHNADIAKCGYYTVFINERKRNYSKPGILTLNREEGIRAIFHNKYVQSYVWDKLFRREIVSPDFPEGKYFEDYPTTIKWYEKAKVSTINPRPLYNYRMRGNSIVNDKDTDKKIAFIQAGIQRINFLIPLHIPGLDERSMTLELFNVIVKTSRDVVREFQDRHSITRYLASMQDILKHTPLRSGWRLGLKTWSRLLKLRYTPDLFVFTVKNSYHFRAPKNKRRRYNLF